MEPAERRRWHLDPSTPLFLLLGGFLCGLVLLPLGWLGWYSVTDANGTLSLANFARLATDPTFIGPYLTALGIAASVAAGASVLAIPLAWLVARTDLPVRRRNPRARHRVLRDPAFSRCDRLGTPRCAEQRHPQSMVPRSLRARALRTSIRHLYRRGPGICDGVLQLPVHLRAADKRSRQYSRRARRGLGDPRRHAAGDIAPGDVADGVAGAARGCACRLSAGVDPVRHPGDPRLAGRLSCHHDKDLGALPVSPGPPSGGGRGIAVAAPDDTAAARTAMAARPAQLCRHWRQERCAASDRAGYLASGRRLPLRSRSSLCRFCFPMRR